MLQLQVLHETVYRYRSPVAFGEHKLMLRPRDSHDLRLLRATLTTGPKAKLRWYHDVFGNSVAVGRFRERSDSLRIVSTLNVVLYESPSIEGLVEGAAHEGDSHYPPELQRDLAAAMEPHHPDPDGALAAWARGFVPDGTATAGRFRTLVAMTQGIRSEFTWKERPEPGVQEPFETLRISRGSCRDFTLLMMEAVRHLGFAARFVSGYLYDRGRASDGADKVGGGATHAWVEVYLPGAGWVDFDPTNGGIGNRNLIRIAVAREPRQAVPISGVFYGPAGAAESMDVKVAVRTAPAAPTASEAPAARP